jgi:hypothetical protein
VGAASMRGSVLLLPGSARCHRLRGGLRRLGCAADGTAAHHRGGAGSRHGPAGAQLLRRAAAYAAARSDGTAALAATVRAWSGHRCWGCCSGSAGPRASVRLSPRCSPSPRRARVRADAALSFVYSLGRGLPFLIAALSFDGAAVRLRPPARGSPDPDRRRVPRPAGPPADHRLVDRPDLAHARNDRRVQTAALRPCPRSFCASPVEPLLDHARTY